MHDLRQEIVQDDVLVMKPDKLLKLAEIGDLRMVVDDFVVETQEQTLQLRDDCILVVTRIADQGPARFRIVAREIARFRILAARDRIAEEEFVAVVHIGLIARSAAIDIVEIEGGRAEVGQAVGITVLNQCGHRIEGHIVIDELTEIGIRAGIPLSSASLPSLGGSKEGTIIAPSVMRFARLSASSRPIWPHGATETSGRSARNRADFFVDSRPRSGIPCRSFTIYPL